jgi:hypothetical protein
MTITRRVPRAAGLYALPISSKTPQSRLFINVQGELVQDLPPAPNRSRARVAIVVAIEKPTQQSDREHDVFGRREVGFQSGGGFRHCPQHVEFVW